MSPFERQGRILLAAAIGLLFLSVIVSMVMAEWFIYGFLFAAGIGVTGIFFLLRGRQA